MPDNGLMTFRHTSQGRRFWPFLTPRYILFHQYLFGVNVSRYCFRFMQRASAGLFIVKGHCPCQGLFYFGVERYVPFAILAECRPPEVVGADTIGVVFIHHSLFFCSALISASASLTQSEAVMSSSRLQKALTSPSSCDRQRV